MKVQSAERPIVYLLLMIKVKHSVVCPWLEYFDVEPSNVTRKEEAAVRSIFFKALLCCNQAVHFRDCLFVQNKIEYDREMKQWQAKGCPEEQCVTNDFKYRHMRYFSLFLSSAAKPRL